MKIILLGYMASGKSTIGKKLADVLNYKFIDLDAYIEDREGLLIKDLFKSKGEIYFRKVEHERLKEILAANNNFVLSLGGGTPCYANNMELINHSDNVQSIYLKASLMILVNRLFNEKNHRPLVERLKTKEELTEFIGKHLFERNHFYNQADYTLITDRKTTGEVLEELIIKLYQ